MSKRRHLAASAIAIATAAALAPSAALASSSTSHGLAFVKTSVGSVKPLAAHTFVTTTLTRVQTAAASPIVLSAVVSQTSALGVSVDVSKTTDSAAGATLSYTFNYGDNGATTTTQSTHTYAKPGVYTVTVVATDNQSNTASASGSFTTQGNDYNAYGPTRVLDTRAGTGAAKAQIAANGTVKLKIGGNGAIPSNVTAVALNVTVTDAHGNGFVTAYADGTPLPNASSVNYHPGQTVPNLVIVPVSPGGYVDLTNSGSGAGGIDLIADVAGYFTPSSASGYTSLTPDRLVDTRNGTGVAQGQLGQNGTFSVQVAGADGGQLPAGITAVALNVTVTNTAGSGFLTVFPDGGSVPTASNVNYSAGQTIANSVIAPVGSDGRIDVFNGGSTARGTDVIVDVTGYYDTGSTSAYVPVAPTRVIDTRNGTGLGGPNDAGQLPNNDYLPVAFNVDGNNDVVPGYTAYVLNATVTNTGGNGLLAVAPDLNTWQEYVNGQVTPGNGNLSVPPNSSNLNWSGDETVPNLVQASTGNNGVIDFFNLGASGGATDLIVDAFGYYQND